MKEIVLTHCPSSLKEGYSTYSKSSLHKLFNGKKVSHILPYSSPLASISSSKEFEKNRRYISISGVQEKYGLTLVKNKLRLSHEGEKSNYILKPIPDFGLRKNQLPANEHLTMQIAKQIYNIETAENALVFFEDGSPAYITKRFDINEAGDKMAQDDFASLAGRTPQSHGSNYKYLGSYLDCFELMEKYLPAYKTEAPKLLKLIIFNYLFSNGDAHFKNFSIVETKFGDYKLSPAYDLLNSRIHVEDKDFALEYGLLPPKLKKGGVANHFKILSKHAKINEETFNPLFQNMLSHSDLVKNLIKASYLNESTKKNYWQTYLGKLKQLKK